MSTGNENEKEPMDYEKIALSIAKDLVDMAKLTELVLEKASFPLESVEDVRLLDKMIECTIELYTEAVEDNSETT